MSKNIQITGGLIVLSFLLFSCASKAAERSSYDRDFSNDSGYDNILGYESGVPAKRESSSNQRSSETAVEERMVAYTISLELAVKDTEETRKKLVEQVEKSNGFIVRESDNYVSARIPAKNADTFINDAKTLGITENESKTGTDITDQYRDNVIRLENLRAVRARYLTLLDKANNVTDILSIEKELERVNTQIELMEGRIKHAQESVVYSSVTVRFREKAKPGPLGWIFYGLYQGVKWLFVWN